MEMVYDPRNPFVEESEFDKKDWALNEFGNVKGKEEMIPNMTQSQGIIFIMREKVYRYHASDTATRRSRMGFIAY